MKNKYEAEHLAMANMLWSTLYNLNMSDPKDTGARELSWYHTDVGEGMSPYRHVQAALLYALRQLTGFNEEHVTRLRHLLADNGEDVEWNLRVLREELVAEEAERIENAFDAEIYGVFKGSERN